MIPELEYVDYITFLFSFISILFVFLPCIPALIISFIKNRSMNNKFKFSLLSCALSYGVALLVMGSISAPFMVINTFLTPKWQMFGDQYKDFAYFFINFERVFSELLFIPFVIIASVIIPFKLIKLWQLREVKAC